MFLGKKLSEKVSWNFNRALMGEVGFDMAWLLPHFYCFLKIHLALKQVQLFRQGQNPT